MRTTLTVIKADVGSIGGHIKPSVKLIEAVEAHVMEYAEKKGLINDYFISHTGDDVAILVSHQRGRDDEEIHKLAWDAFKKGTEVAKEQGLYGAGQDLLVDSFSGNVKGLGPAVAELEFDERPNEPFVLFAADKTEPGAYNLPFYLAFADPMHNSALLLSPEIQKGFTFTIMDVSYTKGDRFIELKAPDDIYRIAALLRDPNRFVIESIRSNNTGEVAAVVSTTRLHNIAGKYVGKDDPVALVRVQKDFPATGELIHPFSIVPYVSGFMRGSHIGPLMPAKTNSSISFFDGPPIVSATAFCVRNGKFTEHADLFEHPFWDEIRRKATNKALSIREQGFYGAAMLGMNELEYGGIKDILEELDKKFKIRASLSNVND